MTHRSRMIASLLALGAGAALLVADAPPPECDGYEGFDLTLEYYTDCVDRGVPSGTITVSAASHTLRDEAEVVVEADGPLTVRSATGWWTCGEEGGADGGEEGAVDQVGRIANLSFQVVQIAESTEEGETGMVETTVTCSGYRAGGAEWQDLDCGALGTEGAACTLSLMSQGE